MFTKKILIVMVVLMMVPALVKAESKSPVKLDITVEDTMIDLTLSGPSKLFMGFSHFPKSKREKLIWKKLRESWEVKYDKIFTLSEGASCTMLDASFEIQIDVEEHILAGQYKTPVDSDVKGSLQLLCEDSLIGQSLGIRLKEHFYRIPSVQVELLTSEGEHKSLVIKDRFGSVEI